MTLSRLAAFDVLRILAEADISATYAPLGDALSYACRCFRLKNSTDGNMFFTYTNGSVPASDGSADIWHIDAGSFVLVDVASDSSNATNGAAFSIPEGSQFWVRYDTAPSLNSVYVDSILYAKGGGS